MILFCLPYSGGSKNIFYKWTKNLSKDINMIPIELKGRGERTNEGFYKDIKDAVDDVVNIINKYSSDEDYIIFGHSLGGLLAYEAYFEIIRRNMKIPGIIIFSGCAAPFLKRKTENISNLPDEIFINKVISLGGTPKEITQYKELLDIFIPILHNDFRIIEEYEQNKNPQKISCKSKIIYGHNDRMVNPNEIICWKECTEGEIEFYEIEGNHFYIKTEMEKVVEIINESIK